MSAALCRICAAPYAPFGFLQLDGEYFFYCPTHKDRGEAHPPSREELGRDVPPQMSLDFSPDAAGAASFKSFLASGTYDWETGMVGFIRFMVPEGATDTGETWRHQAEKWIGKPPNPNVVGAAIRRAAERDLIVKTGRYVAPRDRKSHASAKPEWRRTGVK